MDKKDIKKAKKAVFISIIAIAIIALVLTFVDTRTPQSLSEMFEEPEKIVIEDRCSLVMGNLFHEIKNKEECRIKCKSNCEVRGEEFSESEFIKNNSSCHTCNCYCK